MRRKINQADAEDIAIRALGFLAADPERLGRFLAITGLGPENLRRAASEPHFLAGVLAHVAEDESLLMAMAGDLALPPQTIAEAQALMAGPPPDDF